ncbi:MAG: DUF885 domain-containing protein [Polyangiaceae bacterium]|nr:DUF885 domain-containing protein [Polyangiaceae bacterium]
MRPALLTIAMSLGAALSSCAGQAPTATVANKSADGVRDRGPLAADAVAGVTDKTLATLLEDHFDWELRQSPTRATRLGDHRFDSELGRERAEDIEASRKERKAFVARARGIDASALSADDRTTLALLVGDLEADMGAEVCEAETWELSSFSSPVSATNHLPELHLVSTAADAKHLLARYGEIERVIHERQDNLRRGLREGRVASRESVKRLLAQLERQLGRPVKEWSLLTVLSSPAAKERRKSFTAAEEAAFLDDAAKIVETRVAPAYRAFRDFVSKEILPAARPDDREGVSALPGGGACYRARIVMHLGSAREPEELHRTGLAEIERINGEMRLLGKKLFGTDDIAAILNRLRTDKELYFDTPQAVEEAAKKALEKARAAIPQMFGILPKTDCVVSVIPEEEAPFTTVAYYREPNYDGTKPGEYFINTYRPEIRPKFEMEALSYHESIPGHHLQIAIAQERGALPAFRKFGRATAFVEGWALYTEKLADESGLYSSDLDRMGMLSYDAWRASRLVVDTGMHHLGWTRAKAEEYMQSHTALTASNIENEVDRYIAWPGQALAYKVGQLEISRLRQSAKEALGAKFDLKGFHDAVLSSGPVTLPVLQQQIDAWVSSRRQ